MAKNHQTGVIIGFDSLGWYNGQALEKPDSRKEALNRLRALSDNTHKFYTGIHLINIDNNKTLTKVIETTVIMRKISDYEINKYLDEDPNYKTYAPGFDPQGHYSSTFVKEIKGSYNSLLRGIPLETIIEMLQETGYDISKN
ncbi:MAG TPA: Maf family protein [Candidatus Nanoarchaeia archaeon]|nr:Maf family protein [Candidatus Nanoarchaeia archaeon]